MDNKNLLPSTFTEKIAADRISAPIIICDINGGIIYKNKAAYEFGFPRKGSGFLSCFGVRDRERILNVIDGRCKFAIVNYNSRAQFLNLAAVSRVGDGLAFLFIPPVLDSHSDKEDKEMERFEELACEMLNRLDISRCSKAPRCKKSADLERRCMMLAFEKVDESSKTWFSVENTAYIVNKYFKLILKNLSKVRCNCTYSFCNEFPEASISYVEHPEAFATAFLGVISGLVCADDIRGIEISVYRRGERVIFEAHIQLGGENFSAVVDGACRSSFELRMLSRIAECYGWGLRVSPISEFISPNSLLVMLEGDAHKGTKLMSENANITPEAAFVRFIAFLLKKQ